MRSLMVAAVMVQSLINFKTYMLHLIGDFISDKLEQTIEAVAGGLTVAVLIGFVIVFR